MWQLSHTNNSLGTVFRPNLQIKVSELVFIDGRTSYLFGKTAFVSEVASDEIGASPVHCRERLLTGLRGEVVQMMAGDIAADRYDRTLASDAKDAVISDRDIVGLPCE